MVTSIFLLKKGPSVTLFENLALSHRVSPKLDVGSLRRHPVCRMGFGPL